MDIDQETIDKIIDDFINTLQQAQDKTQEAG